MGKKLSDLRNLIWGHFPHKTLSVTTLPHSILLSGWAWRKLILGADLNFRTPKWYPTYQRFSCRGPFERKKPGRWVFIEARTSHTWDKSLPPGMYRRLWLTLQTSSQSSLHRGTAVCFICRVLAHGRCLLLISGIMNFPLSLWKSSMVYLLEGEMETGSKLPELLVEPSLAPLSLWAASVLSPPDRRQPFT